MRMRGLRSPLVGAALAGLLLGSSIGAAATEIPPTGPGFGDYELVPLLRDGQPYAGPPTPTSLDGVALTELVDNELDVGARKALAEQGFVVVPARYRLLHDAYAEQFWNGTPVLVTTDVAYHCWHLVFDKILRDLEQDRLLPALENLVRGMRRNATKQTDGLAGTAVAEDAERVSDLMATTACVLGLRCELSDRVRAELALIEAHAEWTPSPILGTRTDYSLFTPRGHYTRNEDLKRYFVAMSVLGQHAFELPGAREAGGLETARNEALRRAILASRQL